MADEGSPAIHKSHVAPWIATIAILSVAFVFGYGTNSIDALVEKLWGSDFRRVVRILMRLWLYSTPAGAIIGILLGYLVLRDSRLAQATIRFLRVGRWAPFLIWWVLAAQLTLGLQKPLPLVWFLTYGAVTAALAACYEFLAARFVLGLPLRAALGSIVRAVIIQGILIALVLDMSVWVELWSVYPRKTSVGYKVFIVLAMTILSINWAFRRTFDHAAVNRGTVLIEELKYDNWSSFWGASALVVICFGLWQGLAGPVLLHSPMEVLAALDALVSSGEFLWDIYVSLAEIVAGLALSGGIAAFMVFVMNRAARLKGITDGLLQVTQVAPIALLPNILGFFEIRLYRWSTVCVAVFCFYPFARAFLGLRGDTILRRTLLAFDEALPYGAAAIVYGEMMNATAGLSFMMIVASAANQTAKGLAGFITLLFLVATFSTLLRWIAKRT